MTKSIQVTESVHADLMILKGVFGSKNLSETLRKEMNHAGHNAAWFERIVPILQGAKTE